MASPTAELENDTRKYTQVAGTLREQIEAGVLKPGERLPSFVQMRSLGIGQNTAEKVHALLEREGLIVRKGRRGIFVAEPSGTMVPETRIRTGLIGFNANIFLTRKRYYHSAELTAGVQEVLSQTGNRMVMLDGNSPDSMQELDGAILTGADMQDIARHLPSHVPCVTLLSHLEGRTCVMSNDFDGARQAVQHLVSLGHRRIGCLMDVSAAETPRLRVAGYREAMDEAGIEPLSNWVRRGVLPFPEEGYEFWARASIAEWAAEDPQLGGCTALLVHNDLAAIGVMDAMRKLGRRIPEDMSIVGFDGIDACEYLTPTLTSVEVPLRQIGATAAQILLRQMEEGPDTAQTVSLPTRLVARRSTVAYTDSKG